MVVDVKEKFKTANDVIDDKTGECMSKPLDDLKDAIYGTKEESDVDVSNNLEAESQLGK